MVSLSDPASWKRSSPCPHAMRQEVTDGLVDRTTTSLFVDNFWESSPIPWHLHSVQILPQSGPSQEETIENFLCWVQLQNRFFVVTCSSAVRVSAALMFQVWITTWKLIFSSSHSFPKLALSNTRKNMCILRSMHLDQLGFLRKSAFNIFGPKLWDSHVQPTATCPASIRSRGCCTPLAYRPAGVGDLGAFDKMPSGSSWPKFFGKSSSFHPVT